MAGAGAPGLRKRLSKRLRYWRNLIAYGHDYQRLTALRGSFKGQRAFLVANGPSLQHMDLAPLAGEFVCVVNMGVRGVGGVIPKASMHVVLDNNRYRRFAGELEGIAAAHAIPYRFLSWNIRGFWHRQPVRAAMPYWILGSPDTFEDKGPTPSLRRGLHGSGATVLIGAAEILAFMGFSEVYVLGCDLAYTADAPYFYTMGTLDTVHEADPKVIARRADMVEANAHFAQLRRVYEAEGRRLVNAGVGGNLDALPRQDFAALFSR